MRHSQPLHRRRVLRLGAASLAALTPLARAQGGKPLKIVVGYAAGGSSDQTARLVADQLRERLGRPVVVENRTGAGGRIMLGQVKNAKPDGDTLAFVAHGQMVLFQHVYKNLPYAPFKDFTPVARLCDFDFVLSAGPDMRDLAAYMAWAKDPANKAGYASPGTGTVPHFIGQLFAEKTQLKLTNVPYRGSAPGISDLLGGQISMAISPLADMLQFEQAGRLRALATTGRQRGTFLPDTPTLKESGVDIAIDGWYGLFAPAATPADTVARLNEALQASAPALKEPLAKLALTANVTSAAALAEHIRGESAFWAQAVKSTGFKPTD